MKNVVWFAFTVIKWAVIILAVAVFLPGFARWY